MPSVEINLLSVLVAGISAHLIGWVWFMPRVFGNAWMKSQGKIRSEISKMSDGKSMGALMFMSFVSLIVMSYVLAHFADYAGSTTVWSGVQLGFWTWFGFLAVCSAGAVFWDGKNWSWWRIMNAYYLIQLMVMGVILSLWR